MANRENLIRVAVVFGGRSIEHEISILTGLEVIDALDSRKYDPIPVYIGQDGSWYTGDPLKKKDFYRHLPDSLSEATPVILLPVPGQDGLLVLDDSLSISERFIGKCRRKTLPVDIFLPALHGTIGEDGCIQGLFEMAEYAYTGCGVEAASIGMNKARCKRLLKNAGTPVLPDVLVTRDTWRADPLITRKAVISSLGLDRFPLFVKPCNLGSSIGISSVDNVESIDVALTNVFRYDTEALIEPKIQDVTEINVSVLEGSPTRASVVEVPQPSGGVLTFEEKYMRGNKSKKSRSRESLASMQRQIDPDDLPSALKKNAQDLALRAFSVIGCSGVSRIDFILDNNTERLYFNEINTLPGSMSYYLWEESDPPLTYTGLLTQLLDQALKDHASLLGRNVKSEFTLF